MKDMPALLLAFMCQEKYTADPKIRALTLKAFDRIVNNGRMLRNFVQILRSGAVGRKSLGTFPRSLVRRYLSQASDDKVFRDSVGNDPSIADIIKMTHPKPGTESRSALYGYLLGRDINPHFLPRLVQDFEAFKTTKSGAVPNVPFQMLTGIDELPTDVWKDIARNGRWHQTRMNLNTYARHGVLKDQTLVDLLASRISDATEVRSSMVFPYQLLAAYIATEGNQDIPVKLRNALQDALEVAAENIPTVDGKVFVLVDKSGSMGSAVTGYRAGATSAVSCIQVAALVAACMVRKNEETEVITFDGSAQYFPVNPRDSIMTVARQLSQWGGATACSTAVRLLNREKRKGDFVVMVSDNMSWMEYYGGSHYYGRQHTGLAQEWAEFKSRNPKSRLVNMDIQPYTSTQHDEDTDVLNIGGFSDHVFTLLSEFAGGRMNPEHWVGVIESTSL